MSSPGSGSSVPHLTLGSRSAYGAISIAGTKLRGQLCGTKLPLTCLSGHRAAPDRRVGAAMPVLQSFMVPPLP